MLGDAFGGIVSDLDVVPRCRSLDEIAHGAEYVFDRCSRRGVIANDFFYVGRQGLPGIFAYFARNLKRVNAIPAYEQR